MYVTNPVRESEVIAVCLPTRVLTVSYTLMHAARAQRTAGWCNNTHLFKIYLHKRVRFQQDTSTIIIKVYKVGTCFSYGNTEDFCEIEPNLYTLLKIIGLDKSV